jgi:hypothetical protein
MSIDPMTHEHLKRVCPLLERETATTGARHRTGTVGGPRLP